MELSGNCPPSPNRRTSAFSRLIFEVVLSHRALRSRTFDDSSSIISDAMESRLHALAGFVDGDETDPATLS